MFKTIMFSLLIVLSTSCATAPQKPVTPEVPRSAFPATLVECVYKYDNTRNVSFMKSELSEYHPPSLPELMVYHIIDLKGKHWAINQYEWNDYSCKETIITG